MVSLRRVLAVTGGLILVGILAGGLAASCAVAITALIWRDWHSALDPALWRFSAMVGGAIGAVVAPATSWLFLRHVPLGRLIFQTTVATALAGGIGFGLHFNPFIAAPLGFLAAAIRLAVVTPSRPPPDALSPGRPPGALGP